MIKNKMVNIKEYVTARVRVLTRVEYIFMCIGIVATVLLAKELIMGVVKMIIG